MGRPSCFRGNPNINVLPTLIILSVSELHYILYDMQVVEIQRVTEELNLLREKLLEKVEELKQTKQKVSYMYNCECNDFPNTCTFGQFLQLLKVENDLQTKHKQLVQVIASIKGKQTQLPSIQADKQSCDAATQSIYSDVVECKSTTFLVITIL